MAARKATTMNAAGGSRSMRSCVVCRATRPVAQMLPLHYVRGNVVATPSVGGRGAHVCVAGTCLSALSDHELRRAFRLRSLGPEAVPTLAQLHQVAERRLDEVVALARRQGLLASASGDDAHRRDSEEQVGKIAPGRLADRAAYWRNVCYETRGDRAESATVGRGA